MRNRRPATPIARLKRGKRIAMRSPRWTRLAMRAKCASPWRAKRREWMYRSLPSVCPAPEACADSVTGAHRREQYKVALLQPSALDGVARGQRDGSRRSVAIAVDVDDDLVTVETQPFCAGCDDPAVRLMGDQQLQVFGGEPVAREKSARRLVHFPHGIFENLLSILVHVVH